MPQKYTRAIPALPQSFTAVDRVVDVSILTEKYIIAMNKSAARKALSSPTARSNRFC